MDREINNLEQSMQMLRLGNLDAFDDIYNATYKSVFFVIYGIIKDYQLTEDVVQNTYIRVCDKINLYQPSTNPTAWIITIARNLALNELRNHKKEVLVDLDDLSYLVDENQSQTITETPLIDLAKRHLNDLEFQIVMLCAVNNYKRREVAKMLQLPISTVTWHYNKSLNKLRKIITKGGERSEKKSTKNNIK